MVFGVLILTGLIQPLKDASANLGKESIEHTCKYNQSIF